MICYRIVHLDYSSFYDAFSGVGAASAGGRWNGVGINATYVSTEIQTAVAEKAFYSIINKAYLYKNKTKLTNYEALELLDIEYVLIEVDISSSLTQNNFTNQKTLSASLGTAKLPNASVLDSILSPWQKLPNKWTSALGSSLHASSEESCKTLSARNVNGINHIIYNDNFLLTNLTVRKKYKILISAADVKNIKKWKGSGSYSLTHAYYEVPDLGFKGIVEVQNIKIT